MHTSTRSRHACRSEDKAILLGLLVINCAFVGIYLAIRPTPVEAEDTEPRAAEQARQQFQQPMVFNVSDQIEILRQKEERLKARELELKELEGQIQGKIKRLEDIEAAIKSDLASYRSSAAAGETPRQDLFS